MVKRYLNRVVYTAQTKDWLDSLSGTSLDCLEISGSEWQNREWRSYTSLNFPECDICADPFTDERGGTLQFDIIMAEQIWEHLDRPYRATRNVHTMLRKGGYFWLATPFLAKFHGVPVDCSRWSARGLKNLLIECGFEESKIESFQWGNRKAANKDMRRGWGIYDPETDDLQDDPRFPIMSWAIAQK